MKTDEKITLRIRLEDKLVRWLESPYFPLTFLLATTVIGIVVSAVLITGLYA